MQLTSDTEMYVAVGHTMQAPPQLVPPPTVSRYFERPTFAMFFFPFVSLPAKAALEGKFHFIFPHFICEFKIM